jgi:hypothetical protein
MLMFYAVRSMRGRSRDSVRLNFDVSMNNSTFTNYYFTPISELWSGNFGDFFAGKKKNFGVVGAKMAIL